MENEFIKILGMAEWEDEVVEIIEKYKLPNNFEEGDASYKSWTPSCSYFGSFTFSNKCETLKQKERKAEGNYYLNSMFFKFSGIDSDDNVIENKDGLDIPFGFIKGDTYKDVIEKLGEPHFERRKLNKNASILRKLWILKKENGEEYRIFVSFDNKSKNLDLKEISLWTLDTDEGISKEYFVPHSYNPLEDKERNNA